MIYSTISTLSWRFFLFFFWIIAILKFLDPLLPGRRMPIPGDKHLQEGERENLKGPSDKGVDGSTRVRIFSIFMENEFFSVPTPKRPSPALESCIVTMSLCSTVNAWQWGKTFLLAAWCGIFTFLKLFIFMFQSQQGVFFESKAETLSEKLHFHFGWAVWSEGKSFFWKRNFFFLSNFYQDIWYILNF